MVNPIETLCYVMIFWAHFAALFSLVFIRSNDGKRRLQSTEH